MPTTSNIRTVLAEQIVSRENKSDDQSFILVMNERPLSLTNPPQVTLPAVTFSFCTDRRGVICRSTLNEHDVISAFIRYTQGNPVGIYWICNLSHEPVAYLTHDDVLVYRPTAIDHVTLIRRMLDAGITVKGLALIGA